MSVRNKETVVALATNAQAKEATVAAHETKLHNGLKHLVAVVMKIQAEIAAAVVVRVRHLLPESTHAVAVALMEMPVRHHQHLHVKAVPKRENVVQAHENVRYIMALPLVKVVVHENNK